jgi:hypothetical protein
MRAFVTLGVRGRVDCHETVRCSHPARRRRHPPATAGTRRRHRRHLPAGAASTRPPAPAAGAAGTPCRHPPADTQIN